MVTEANSSEVAEGRLKIIVAVDFGTTFSSVAYANTKNPELNRHKMLEDWGRGGWGITEDKVPSVLRYKKADIKSKDYEWGYQARKHVGEGELIHEWFKLGLCHNFEDRKSRDSELERIYKSRTALPRVEGDGCQKLVTDFLRGIRESVDDFFDRDETVSMIPREYIITVPAQWDHAEQDKTRECAKNALMGDPSRIQLISEPEAAGIYAIETMFSVSSKVGDTFVICDAGGGTVDLASYTIVEKEPHIKLRAAATNSGGLCGSSYLNRIFEAYLDRKLTGYKGSWNEDCLREAAKAFETEIKPLFNGDDLQNLRIRIHGLKASSDHGIVNNFLTFTAQELREEVFDQVITKVQGLVRHQIARTSGEVKKILLVGGFGRNPYLKKRLEEVGRVETIGESQTAIARGALIAGLNRQGRTGSQRVDDGGINFCGADVISRRVDLHYGIWAYDNWVEKLHTKAKRVQREDGYKVRAMRWFARMNDDIPDGEPVSFSFEKVTRVDSGPPPTFGIVSICASDTDPQATLRDDPSVQEVAELNLDFRDIPAKKVWRRGVELYVVKFDVEMTVDSAGLVFCAVFGSGTKNAKRFEPKHVQLRSMG